MTAPGNTSILRLMGARSHAGPVAGSCLSFHAYQTHGDPFSDIDLTEAIEAAVNNLTIMIEDTRCGNYHRTHWPP